MPIVESKDLATQSQAEVAVHLSSDFTQNIDFREQLYNSGDVGLIKDVQVSTERIVRSNGILYDLDPKLYRPSSLLPTIPTEPAEFYAVVAKPWLSRHAVLNHLEVRNSGTGLHGILWFSEPVTFDSDQDRQRWAGIIQVVQAALPVDPDQPGITAVTRPSGSINSKNGATVSILKSGAPVSHEDVLALYDEMRHAPFKTVMRILGGSDRLTPCPICGKDGSRLSAMDRVGQCYGSCGTVRLEQLYDAVLAPRSTKKQEADHVTA